jgi:hypothetical protein
MGIGNQVPEYLESSAPRRARWQRVFLITFLGTIGCACLIQWICGKTFDFEIGRTTATELRIGGDRQSIGITSKTIVIPTGALSAGFIPHQFLGFAYFNDDLPSGDLVRHTKYRLRILMVPFWFIFACDLMIVYRLLRKWKRQTV